MVFLMAHEIRIPDLDLYVRYSTQKFLVCKYDTNLVIVDTVKSKIDSLLENIMFKTKLDLTNTRHSLFVFRMAGSIAYFACIENALRYRRLDTCLHDKEFELCISVLTGHMTWVFCLMIRNTLIMHCKQ
jgi:hypothetical protein